MQVSALTCITSLIASGKVGTAIGGIHIELAGHQTIHVDACYTFTKGTCLVA